MKFIFFLASTMLIVSISQYSVMGFPVNETTEQPCTIGFERINGQCVPISSTTNANTLESSSFPTVTMIMPEAIAVVKILPKMDACPPGTTRGQNDLCERIERFTTTATPLESSSFPAVTMLIPGAVAVTDVLPKMNACPPGTTRGQNDRCERIQRFTTTAVPLESSSMESSSFSGTTMINPEATSVTTLTPEVTTIDMSEKSDKMDVCPPGTIRGQSGQCESTELFTTTEVPLESSSMEPSSSFTTTMMTPDVTTIGISGKSKISEDCPPNTIRGKNDECEPIERMTTAEAEIEPTTELNEEPRKQVNIMQCPEGTKRDDDGACQEVVRANQTKTTDPKIFLKKDGSCPNGYKKIKGQCLYMEPKRNATLVSGESLDQDRLQPKSGSDEGSNLNTLVRTNEDGSCPTGTQNYETGLCMVVVQPLTPALNSKTTCGDAYELINGKCIRKGLTESDQLEPGTERMIVPTEQSNTDDELVESTPSVDSKGASTKIILS